MKTKNTNFKVVWKVILIIILTSTWIAVTVCAGFSGNKHIDWYHADFPPGFISTGESTNDGYENYLEKILREGLPEFSHSYHSANYSRILQQIKTSNACCVALVRTPDREKYIEYSRPTMIALPNGVIVRSDRIDDFKPFIDSNGYISIEDVFNNSTFIMGVSKGRKYKGDIDKLLVENKGSPKIVVREGKDVLRGMLAMMARNRHIDYTIGYAHELKWLNYVKKISADFVFIPIKEVPKYVVSQIGCTKNYWGKKVIKRINAVLDENYNPEYKKRYQKFLTPEAVILHEKYIKEVFPTK
ncbi:MULTISPECIES: TIGR02285 family protein [unclassified Maridesulfovibrio]|uniref:TIGR02285 family protein n=1 Tax=unclassified Maridesulfovibrio TaxID=2794999 RepID=UPI003B3C0391